MMKTLLLSLALTAVAVPAYAQPGTEPIQEPAVASAPPPQPATTAPQNEEWNNVSHINGQVVPVGERGNFLYKAKKTNIASNPIGWLTGFYGVSVSHAVHDNVVLRVDANLINLPGSSITGYEFGASVPIYFKRAFHGPFLEPGIIVRDIREGSDNFDDEFTASDTGMTGFQGSFGPSVVAGYHWTFDSGLNLAAAFGVMRNLNADDEGIEPSGYFRVGYAF